VFLGVKEGLWCAIAGGLIKRLLDIGAVVNWVDGVNRCVAAKASVFAL